MPSYNEIVKSCKLFDYKLEYAAGGSVWAEYWDGGDVMYKALFHPDSTSMFPTTYFKIDLND